MTDKRVSRRRIVAGAVGITAVAAGVGGLSQALVPGRMLEPRLPTSPSTPAPSESPSANRTTPPARRTRHLVLIGEQSRREVLVLDAAVGDWGSSAAVRWRWRLPAAWGKPGDVKVCNIEAFGGRVLLVCTRGHVGIVDYPEGTVRWQLKLPAGAGAHTAEALPGGLLAVAGTGQHWVRIYRFSGADASGSTDHAHDAELPVRSPHGLQWDQRRRMLWTLGYSRLSAVRVAQKGSAASVTVAGERALPSKQHGGHDLTASHSRPGVLLLTTAYGILGYDTRQRDFVAPSPGASALMSQQDARAVGDWSDGRLMWNGPPADAHGTWTTDTVRFDNPDTARRLPDSSFYKARPFLTPHS